MRLRLRPFLWCPLVQTQKCGRIIRSPVPLTVGSSVDKSVGPVSSLQPGCSKNMHEREKVGVKAQKFVWGLAHNQSPANEESSRTRFILVAESLGRYTLVLQPRAVKPVMLSAVPGNAIGLHELLIRDPVLLHAS